MPILPAGSVSAAKGAVVPLGTITLTSPSISGITFSSIPQGYQDLMLVTHTRNTYAWTTNPLNVYINNTMQSPSSWSQTWLYGDGANPTANRLTTSTPTYGATHFMPSAGSAPNTFGSCVFHFLNYANTSTFKTVLSRGSSDLGNYGFTALAASLYQSTSAITTLNVGSGYGANYETGSTFTLYGIRSIGQ